MPELPEVETVARTWSEAAGLKGSGPAPVVRSIKFSDYRLRDPIPTHSLNRIFVGQPIQHIFRRAKYLLIGTPQGFGVFHLGMSGRWVVAHPEAPLEAHTHARFHLSQGQRSFEWRYIDPRRFGRMGAHEGLDWQSHPYLQHLGPEPLQTPRLAQHLLKSASSRAIKSMLLDGQVIAGLGNIYVCEILHQAKIHPACSSQTLTLADFKRIVDATIQILKRAIASSGTTLRDYRNALGEEGSFGQLLSIYAQTHCKGCSSPTDNLRMSGRSSWFCPQCQQEPVFS
jgi:formamidopyrimidine-DNA glycosylase